MSQWQPQQYDPQAHQQRLQQYPPPGYGQPPSRRKPGRLIALGIIGALVVIGAIATALNHPAASASSPGRPPALPAAPVAPVAAKPHLIVTFTGSQDENTPPFTVTGTWKLTYSFNCSNYGYSADFIVNEDDSFGAAVNISDLAMKKTGSTWAYNDAGTHYLSVESECVWTMKVYDEG